MVYSARMRLPLRRAPLLLLALLAAGACAVPAARWPSGGAAPAEGPGAVLARFAGALEAGRWAEAHALLSARWRAVYTPQELAVDFAGAGPAVHEAAARVRAALAAGTPLHLDGGRATLALAPAGAAALVAEASGWRVDALE